MDKSIIDNLLEKSRADTYDYPFPDRLAVSSTAEKDYAYNPKRQELSVSTFENGADKRLDKRVLATTKENEKKLKNASMKTVVDELIEKAVYGAGASHGKVERGSGKDSSKPGKVTTPALSEERKKQIIEGGRKKAEDQASSTGLHATAARIRAEKSLDDRTTDLVKSLNVDYGRRKAGSRPGGYRQDPDAGIDRKKEERMDAEGIGTREGPEDKGKYVPGSKTFNNPQDSQDPKIRYKSLDERTCDLMKDLSQQREREIHSAVSKVRMIKEDVPDAEKIDAKNDDVFRAVRTHNNIAAIRTQKSVCDTWQIESPFITKGARVMPLGPGGEVQTLSKDGQRPPGRTPTYQQTEEKQRDVDSGKIDRERKAKKRIADLGAE